MYSEIRKSIYLIIAVTIVFWSCKTNQQSKTINETMTENNTNTQKTSLTGGWHWVKTSCCGRMPVITTPQTENKTIVLNLNKDNSFEKIVNGKNVENGTYEIKNGMNGEDFKTIKLSTVPRDGYISIINDTLIINYGYIDLQTEYYKRVK